MTVSLLVFTRDLRISDNPALTAAARSDQIVPLFVFDDAIMRAHANSATRLAFLLGSLRTLDASLRSTGGRLVVRQGQWAEEVLRVAAQADAVEIHLTEDVSGYAQRRLAALTSAANGVRRAVIRHPGVMISEPRALVATGGGPYQVFTPYYRKWLTASRRPLATPPTRLAIPDHIRPGQLPELSAIATGLPAPGAPSGGEDRALARLRVWADRNLADYGHARDDLAAGRTSGLSPYLHFGCISPRLIEAELGGQPGAEPFIRQLAWRDFFCQLLAAKPDAARQDLRHRPGTWHDDPAGLAAWQAGRTGYPIVDAAMRQLAAEGFLPNRARMIVASFLTKDLLVDWRLGAMHFTALLADADTASNQLNWQWAAGTGTDTRPGRTLSPIRQSKRFDPDGEYIRRYLPELEGLARAEVHDPPSSIRRARRYPRPIVDHSHIIATRSMSSRTRS